MKDHLQKIRIAIQIIFYHMFETALSCTTDWVNMSLIITVNNYFAANFVEKQMINIQMLVLIVFDRLESCCKWSKMIKEIWVRGSLNLIQWISVYNLWGHAYRKDKVPCQDHCFFFFLFLFKPVCHLHYPEIGKG